MAASFRQRRLAMTHLEAERLILYARALHFHGAGGHELPAEGWLVWFERVPGARISFYDFSAAQRFLLASRA